MEPGRRLTARELGLPPDVYAALLWTRDALDPCRPDVAPPDWLRFDMHEWSGLVPGLRAGAPGPEEQYVGPESSCPAGGCGTAFCIGGTTALRLAGLEALPVGYLWTDGDLERFRVAEGRINLSVLQDLFYCFAEAAGLDRSGATAALDRFFAGETDNPWRVPPGPAPTGDQE